jgi:hypothetical protein
MAFNIATEEPIVIVIILAEVVAEPQSSVSSAETKSSRL